MRIKDGFILRDVGGKTFAVAVGELSKTFKGMITLNETGKIIWKELSAGKSEKEIVDKIFSEYEGAKRATVENDVRGFIDLLKTDGVLESE